VADTITVTLDQRTPMRMASAPFGLISGVCNLSAYTAAKVPLTGITGLFNQNATVRVVADGVSSLGYHVRWSPADKAFRAYQSLTAAADTQVADATNVGVFGFHAFGQLG
jgi:hypothetical protein